MTNCEIIAVIISGLSLLASIVFGVITIKKSNKANDIAKEANKISKNNEKIAQGQIELYINQLISQTKKDVMDISLKVADSCINDIENRNSLLTKALNSAIEINLNAYEEACAKYIDNKVDKARFKKNYMVSIRQEVENPINKERFNATTSPYKAILKVYDEWFNLEK